MPIPSLTDQYIDETYARLVQTDSSRTEFADGLGNPITFGTTTPGDGNQSIQFNSASVFSGSSNFKFDYTNNNVVLTGSIIMSGSSYISGVDYVQFDTTAVNTSAVGKLYWNNTDGTLELGLKGGVVKSELGQGLVTRVVNKTSPLIDLAGSNYQVVVVAGAQGQRLAVKLAQADNDANSAGTLGIVAENIVRNEEGFIITVGLLKDIDTTGALQGEDWNDGDILYLSPTTAGAITKVKPQAPQHTVIVGYVEYAHNQHGKIYVKIDNGYEIDELHNVKINGVTSGDLLMYSSSVWINTKTLSGSYTLSGSLTANGGVSVQSVTASIVSASQFTGSIFGTASWANNAITSSYITSSFFTGTNAALSASFATSASFASNSISASYALTSSNIQGGLTNYIPRWATNTSLTSSYLNQFDAPTVAGIQTNYFGNFYGLYLDLANKYYRIGSTFGTYAHLTLDEAAGYFRANYNGADNGLDLSFSTNTYTFGNLPGNQKITIDANSEIINIADQASAGVKVDGGGVRTVTIGDAWGNAGTGTQIITDASGDIITLSTAGGISGIKAEGTTTQLITIGDYANNSTSTKVVVNVPNSYIGIADNANVGVKVQAGGGDRLVTVGDAWGTSGTNTKVVVDATNNVVQVTGSFSVQNGAEFLSSVTLVLGNYADDTEAAANGVPLNGLYRNGNVVSIRVT